MTATLSPSLWFKEAPAQGPPLDYDVQCDVVVIGAGFTGLSAAIRLAREGVHVVVLEREYAGFGASGRNAGHLTPTIGKDLPTLLKAYGADRGGALVRLADEAVEFTEAMLIDHGIECDYVPHGNVIAGIHPGEEKKLRKAAEAARALGAPVRLLESGEIKERRLPTFVSCAAIEEHGGVLDPGKYVKGLRRLAIDSGAILYEQTPVSEVKENQSGVSVVTPRGTVSANTGIVATNAYTPALGLPYGKVIPMRDSQFVTEPLSPQQRQGLGWINGEGIYTTHQSLENYRLTADGCILGGSRYVSYKFRNGIAEDSPRAPFAKIEARFRERFPDLATLRVDAGWSGHIAINANFLPFIGRVGRRQNLVAALGYSGHGLAMSGLFGSIAAGIALGTDGVPKALEGLRYLPLPPEPLRWLSVRAVTAALEIMDRRTDRKAASCRPYEA